MRYTSRRLLTLLTFPCAVRLQAIFDSVVDQRFAVAQLLDEAQYLVSSVGHDDDTVAGLLEDMKDISGTFDRMKCGIRRKLVDLRQTFETNVIEVSIATYHCVLSLPFSACNPKPRSHHMNLT